MAVEQRRDRGFKDEIGRAKIGLADAEIDDVAALRREQIGARQHGKGILLPDALERGNGFQHGTTFSCQWRTANSEIARCSPLPQSLLATRVMMPCAPSPALIV